MSDIAQFTSVFRTQSLSDQQRRVTKRNRQPVSCLACRTRKLKCDRAQPCGACTRRGDGDACKFGPGPGTNSSSCAAVTPSSSTINGAANQNSNGKHGGSGQQKQPRQEVQLRLQKLEDMVQDLVRRGAGPSKERADAAVPSTAARAVPTPTDSEPSVSDGSPTSITADGEEAYYGATHWTALLHHIREIQTALEPEDMTPPQQAQGVPCCMAPDFLFGAVSTAISHRDVLASLPSRRDTDRLVSVYFRARFTAVPFIHTGRFQREYEAFWARPEETSFLWISMLFSIVSQATIIMMGKGKAESLGLEDTLREPSAYSGRAIECLLKGNYLAAKTYSVEATLMVAFTRNIASRDLDPVLWNMFGVATRLAQRRGYHLEPKHLSTSVTPFEAEMRRRAWFYCEAFDLLLSFQLGMPAIIHEGDSDARVPGNHPDEDFDETSVLMPPERPPLDPTPALYYSWKSRLCRILRRVIRHALAPSEPAYSQTRELDDALHRWHAELPPCLAVRPIRATGFSDDNATIMQRLMLELMYSKALCVLHRAYLSRDRADPCFAASRETCRAAAMRVLELHAEFDAEASPGGRLYEDRYMLSSLTLHDFMIAAMVICLDLNECADMSEEDYEKKLNALRTASRIWDGRSDCSRDARRAAAVLRVMLQRLSSRKALKTKNQEGTNGMMTTPSVTNVNGGVDMDPFSNVPPSDIGFGHVSGGGSFGQPQGTMGMYQGDLGDFMALDNALNDPANVDWSLLDQFWSMDRNAQLSMDMTM